MILQFIAISCCGTFFGAAVYISLVQHPAVLEAGGSVGGRFFPHMYKRAAPMQIVLALIGFVSGMILWYKSMATLWLLGAVLLVSVIPITIMFIKPINDILLSSEVSPQSEESNRLLRRWGPKHWWRTIVSGAAFALYLVAGLRA